MNRIERTHPPLLEAALRLLLIASIVGLLYCFLIVSQMAGIALDNGMWLYVIWFAIAALSTYMMLNDDIWGAYALAIVTLAVTVFDIVRGAATIGGASLGLLVAIIIVGYIRSVQSPAEE